MSLNAFALALNFSASTCLYQTIMRVLLFYCNEISETAKGNKNEEEIMSENNSKEFVAAFNLAPNVCTTTEN